MGRNNGLSFDAMQRMSVGAVVDYCIEAANQRTKAEKEKDKPKKRKANQADWNAFLG